MSLGKIISDERRQIIRKITGPKVFWSFLCASTLFIVVLRYDKYNELINNDVTQHGSPSQKGVVNEEETYSDDVKKRISEYLEKKDKPNMMNPMVHMVAHYKVVPEYGLAACEIEKSMATMLQSVMCYLYDTEGFEAAGRDLNKEVWEDRFCAFRNEVFSSIDLQKLFPAAISTIFVVRDPIERFISGFTNKCVNEQFYSKMKCYGCRRDISCVVNKLHSILLGTSNGSIPLDAEVDYEMRHFAPQSWYCDLENNFKTYEFVKYGSHGEEKQRMIDVILRLFEQHGVPRKKLDYLRNVLAGEKQTVHKTSGSRIRTEFAWQLMNNSDLIEKLKEIYYYDYQLFGFDINV